MSQQQSSTRGTSQSNLLRTEGGLQRVVRPKNSSRSLLNTSVAALLEGHAPPVHPQEGLNNPLARAALLSRTLPAASESPDANQRRMLMDRRQLQWPISPLQPPTCLAVNTRLELQNSLSMGVGDHNQLRYNTHAPISGAVNSSAQQVDKGKRPLLAEQVNPNNPDGKKRAVEKQSESRKYNPITKKMMAMKADAHRNGIELMKNMPTVWAKGLGAHARKVQGFIYSYGSMQSDDNNGEDVRIMCSCHGALHSPSAFVKHAGGIDVKEPMKHIGVNVMVSAPQFRP